MRLVTKVRIDHSVGRAVCYALFPLVRLAELVLRPDHSIRDENVRCIAVAKYYGLGSIIHATPLVRALRRRYPGARMVFVTHKNHIPLLQLLPDVDEVVAIDDSSFTSLAISTATAIRALFRRRVDLFLDLELFSSYGALVCLFSLARNRLGFLCGLEADFKTYLYTHLMYFNFHMPIRMCYLQLGRMAGVAAGASSALVAPVLGNAVRASARSKLDAILETPFDGARPPILAVNVNASELSIERRWCPERYEPIAKHFLGKGYRVLFVGSSSERSYVGRVVGGIQGVAKGVYNVAGDFSLPEFLAFLQECDALLTTDTGTMNFAYALDVPTVSLWGPDSPVQYHVPKPSTRAIWESVYCSPCIYRFLVAPCGGNNVCMKLIGVQEVVNALESLLNRDPQEAVVDTLPSAMDDVGSPLGAVRAGSQPPQ